MSDGPDGSGQIQRRRVGDGGAPVSGGLAMVLAAIALIAGFFILRSISDSGEQSLDFNGSGDLTDGSADDAGVTTTTAAPLVEETTTTTEPPLVTTGASVIVANANGLGGTAGAMTRELESAVGFQMVDPTDASSTVPVLETSVIYYEPSIAGAQAVAESLNRVLGGDLQVSALQGTPPTSDGSMGGAGVLLMLGTDKANKTVAELSVVAAASVTPATNPPVAGETTTSLAG
jgi:hypothetical protein